MRTRRLARRAAVAGFVLGVALAVGLAAGGGTVAAQTAPACSTVGFTQNEMESRDWSSDVCSSDLASLRARIVPPTVP